MPRKAKISSLTARGQSAAASSRESAVNIRIDHRRGLKSTKRDRHGAPLALAIFAEEKKSPRSSSSSTRSKRGL